MQYSEYSEWTYVELNEAWTSASTVMTLCCISDTQSRQNSKQHDKKYWLYITVCINVSTFDRNWQNSSTLLHFLDAYSKEISKVK